MLGTYGLLAGHNTFPSELNGKTVFMCPCCNQSTGAMFSEKASKIISTALTVYTR